MKKATIKDVAKYAGVSIAAVSYVINGKDYKVSKETAQKVHKAVKCLNYIPNYSARSLVKNKSKLIGVIIPQTEESKQLILENPFYSEVVSGIERKAREHGYHIILSGVDKGRSYINLSIQRNLDGAIIMGIYHEKFYDELKEIKIPIVLIDSYINDNYFYRIGIDDEYGAYMATKYLIENGHRNIALVTGSIRKDGVVERRFLGYKRALKEANIFYNPNYVFEKTVSYEHGLESGKIIAEKFNEVTAVFTTADLMAVGLIKGIKGIGKEVPNDISVVGFDNILISKLFIPSITTVGQDITKKGTTATELLIKAMENNNKDIPKEVLLPLKIVQRESVKKLNI